MINGSLRSTAAWRTVERAQAAEKHRRTLDESAIPASKFIDVGYKSVTAKNIDEFWAEKREMAALGAKKD